MLSVNNSHNTWHNIHYSRPVVKCLKPSEASYVKNRNEWLGDETINSALCLMQSQFPHCRGLQLTPLGENLQFAVARFMSVQVHNVNIIHWTTSKKKVRSRIRGSRECGEWPIPNHTLCKQDAVLLYHSTMLSSLLLHDWNVPSNGENWSSWWRLHVKCDQAYSGKGEGAIVLHSIGSRAVV